MDKSEKVYNQLIKEYENNEYFDANNARINSQVDINIFFKFKIFFLKIPFMIIKLLIKAILNKKNFLKKNFTDACFKTYFAIKEYILKQFQILRLNSKHFGKELKPGQKYIYYPLHINPEYSTLYQGRVFANQLTIIEALAKSIPHDWVVYVKEHPALVKEIVRSKKFYNRIQELPNVFLAPVYKNSFDIVKKAEMVAIINGTAGWEAILNGIPVIHFSDFLFDVLNLSKKCTDLERLPIIINEEINRMKQITSSQRKKRILTLIEAMLEHSFWATYPNQLFYIEPANDKHHYICAKEIFRKRKRI